jgi:hypothetical protein
MLDLLQSDEFVKQAKRSILTWAESVNKQNYGSMPLLLVDEEYNYVTKKESKFYGMRNASSFKEWVGLYHYIILT